MLNSFVSVAKIAELLDLKCFTNDLNLRKRRVTISDVNRPALQLRDILNILRNPVFRLSVT